ncbi:MAG: nucleotide exchange factor GrpE [Treponema sp.]|jgi:molecular chaperone GrpE (heat shock protein)|nr:nucleotide exchange factor GrpE [Treponema sp.]
MEKSDTVVPVTETSSLESTIKKECPVLPAETDLNNRGELTAALVDGIAETAAVEEVSANAAGTGEEAAVSNIKAENSTAQKGETPPEDTIHRAADTLLENSHPANEQLTAITERLDQLSNLFMERIRYAEHEEKIVDRMHSELEKYKEDIYAQLLRPILLDIIDMRESILRLSAEYLGKVEGEQAIPNKVFANYALEMQDILEKNNVEIYRSNAGETYTPVRQRIVKKIAADSKELHGKVVESLGFGYSYNNRIIFAEKIAVYLYEEPKL